MPALHIMQQKQKKGYGPTAKVSVTTNFPADYHAFSLMYLGWVISTMIIAVSLGIFPNFFLEFGNNQRRVSPKDLWQDLYCLMYDVTL